jgi:muramoyltetrapeptide carboxypeptidase
MIWPNRLKPGDTVAMLAVSGPCDPALIKPAAQALVDLGLRCKIMDSCFKKREFLAGSDKERAADINEAFADPEIKGIFAARGGYGAQRTLPLLDYGIIRHNPKIFVGYSDITALHTVFNNICGFITLHAPMPLPDLSQNPDPFTVQSLKTALFDRPKTIQNPRSNPLTTIVSGRAEGWLTGGNLSLLTSSLGTAYETDTMDRILFIEEINEEPYKIDRMLLQLKLAGKFADCTGILLGRFTPLDVKAITLSVRDLLLPEKKPVLGGLACGHGLPTLTLPLGAYAHMDASGKKIGIYQ